MTIRAKTEMFVTGSTVKMMCVSQRFRYWKSQPPRPLDAELKPTPEQWLAVAQSAQQIEVEPLTDSQCLHAVSLPGEFHKDPADRLIVALARMNRAELVTADGKLLGYPHVKCIPAE